MNRNRGPVKKIRHGNGGKVTYQYVDDVPDLANPIARSLLTQPHLRQRVAQSNKKAYNRKRMNRVED